MLSLQATDKRQDTPNILGTHNLQDMANLLGTPNRLDSPSLQVTDNPQDMQCLPATLILQDTPNLLVSLNRQVITLLSQHTEAIITTNTTAGELFQALISSLILIATNVMEHAGTLIRTSHAVGAFARNVEDQDGTRRRTSLVKR